MASDDPLMLETVRAVWGWTKGHLGIWVSVIESLEKTLKKYDLESDSSLMSVAEYSLFPVGTTVILFLLTQPDDYKITLYKFFMLFAVAYFFLFLAAFSQAISALVCMVRASVRKALISTLLSSSYLPIIGFTDLLLYGNNATLRAEFSQNIGANHFAIAKVHPFQFWFQWALYAWLFYLVASRCIPATRYMYNIGRLRSTAVFIIALSIIGVVSTQITIK